MNVERNITTPTNAQHRNFQFNANTQLKTFIDPQPRVSGRFQKKQLDNSITYQSNNMKKATNPESVKDFVRNVVDSLPRNASIKIFMIIDFTTHDDTIQRLTVREKEFVHTIDNQMYIYNMMGRIYKLLRMSSDIYIESAAVGFLDDKPRNLQTITRVANTKFENCLIKCIKDKVKNINNITNFYKTFEFLNPLIAIDTPYMNEDQIKKLANMVQLNFVIYSELGDIIDVPWKRIGQKRSQVEIIIKNEHATIRNNTQITNVELIDTLPDDLYTDINTKIYKDKDGNTVSYQKLNTLYKLFHGAGTKLKYRFINTIEDLYMEEFITQHTTPIENPIIRDIIRSSEYFITNEKHKEITKKYLIESDANGCYRAYDNNDYYMMGRGFPMGDYSVVNVTDQSVIDEKMSHVIFDSIQNIPEEFTFFHPSINNVLPYPLYQYLIDRNAIINVHTALVPSKQCEISIIEHADSLGLDNKQHKSFCNKLIGKIIQGGIDGKKKYTLNPSNKEEYEQILYECKSNPDKVIDYNLLGVDNMIEVTIKKDNTKAAFGFHSYILAYASINMMKQYLHLKNQNKSIIGYFVDAIFYEQDSDKLPESSTEIGEFKYRLASQFHIKAPINIKSLLTDFIPINYKYKPLHNRTPPTKHTLYLGPGGKTYLLTHEPLFDQIMLTHTKESRTNFQKEKDDDNLPQTVICAQKYFQPSLDDDRWEQTRNQNADTQRRNYVIIDELLTHKKSAIMTMIRRANDDNTIIEATGDFEQIVNDELTYTKLVLEQLLLQSGYTKKQITDMNLTDEIFIERFKKTLPKTDQRDNLIKLLNERTTTREWLETIFDIKDVPRTPNLINPRHTYEYGCLLDTLRGINYHNQKEIIMSNKLWKKITIDQLNNLNLLPTDKIITGSYTRIRTFDDLVQKFDQIPVKDINNNHQLVPKTELCIWYGRTSMNQTSPFKYEPILAGTADCLQGKTYKNNEKIIIDINHLSRNGTLYTAMTRSKFPEQIYILI